MMFNVFKNAYDYKLCKNTDGTYEMQCKIPVMDKNTDTEYIGKIICPRVKVGDEKDMSTWEIQGSFEQPYWDFILPNQHK